MHPPTNLQLPSISILCNLRAHHTVLTRDPMNMREILSKLVSVMWITLSWLRIRSSDVLNIQTLILQRWMFSFYGHSLSSEMKIQFYQHVFIETIFPYYMNTKVMKFQYMWIWLLTCDFCNLCCRASRSYPLPLPKVTLPLCHLKEKLPVLLMNQVS